MLPANYPDLVDAGFPSEESVCAGARHGSVARGYMDYNRTSPEHILKLQSALFVRHMCELSCRCSRIARDW